MRGAQLAQDVNVLGALLAGTFATSREIARMMNETQFRSLLQQGMKQNTLTELVGEVWIIVIMFDKSTHIGLVKDVCRQVTPQLGSGAAAGAAPKSHRQQPEPGVPRPAHIC